MLYEVLRPSVSQKEEYVIQRVLNLFEIDHLGNRWYAMNKLERDLKDCGWKRCNLYPWMPDTPGNTENCVFIKGEYKIAFDYYRNLIIVNDALLQDFSHLDLSVYEKLPNKQRTEEWFETYKKEIK